jgi:hypothetical protein
MKTFIKNLTIALSLLLSAAIAVPSGFAKAKDNKKADPAARIKKKLASAELPAEALAKANKVVDENAPKLKEAQAKVDAALTAEQKRARREALKAAKNSGKKRKQLQTEALTAMKLTPEQKARLESAEKDLKSAQAALMKDLQGALTKDQLTKAGLKTKKKKA